MQRTKSIPLARTDLKEKTNQTEQEATNIEEDRKIVFHRLSN